MDVVHIALVGVFWLLMVAAAKGRASLGGPKQ
jgi:hypothetical protein